MSSFKDTLQIFKRRAGYNTDVDMTDVATDKVARDLGVTKEALVGALLKAPFSLAARGAEGLAGMAVANPGKALMAGFMGHQAKGTADEYQRLTKSKFPRPARGVGVHD